MRRPGEAIDSLRWSGDAAKLSQEGSAACFVDIHKRSRAEHDS